MVGTGVRRWSTVLLLVVAGCCALVSARQVAASVVAAPQHRAVVVIDDGVSRRAHCLVFTGEISGIEALDRTGESTVKTGFGGMGAAVCSIGGTGCSASQCLTCQAPKYWRYYQAEDGATTFRPSGGGASSSRVGDGDVEAWIWGTPISAGAVPTVDSVCGARPTTTTSRPVTTLSRPVAPAPPPTAPGPSGPGPAPGPTSPPTSLPAGPTTTGTGPTGTSRPADAEPAGTTGDGDEAEEGRREERSAPEPDTELTIVESNGGELAAGVTDVGPPDGGSGGWWGVGAVGLVLAGIAAWALLLRRRSAP